MDNNDKELLKKSVDETEIEFVEYKDNDDDVKEDELNEADNSVYVDGEKINSSKEIIRVGSKNSRLPERVDNSKNNKKSVIFGMLVFIVLIALFVLGMKYMKANKKQNDNEKLNANKIQIVKIDSVEISIPDDISVVVNDDKSILISGHLYTPIFDENGNIIAYQDELGVVHNIEDINNNRIIIDKDDIKVLSPNSIKIEKPSSLEKPTISKPN